MQAFGVFLDSALFTVDVAARTAHRYTANYFVNVSTAPEGATITLRPKGVEVNTANLVERVLNDALDDRLRARVSDETKHIHDVLIGAAFRQASPSDLS